MDVVRAVQADGRLAVTSLDAMTIEKATALPTPLEMHDGQIVATGLIRAELGLDVCILTKDKSIVDSRLLPVIW